MSINIVPQVQDSMPINIIEDDDIKTEVSIRRSTRQRKPAISNDYLVYLGESDYDIG